MTKNSIKSVTSLSVFSTSSSSLGAASHALTNWLVLMSCIYTKPREKRVFLLRIAEAVFSVFSCVTFESQVSQESQHTFSA